jgi:hypothetical protein
MVRKFEYCDKYPVYAKKGAKLGRFSRYHKHPNMVNVIKKTCEHDVCNKHPTYAKKVPESLVFVAPTR